MASNSDRTFDGYIRVSAVMGRGGESFQSPQQQRELIERWAASHGIRIGAWHTDLDQTGARMERPALVAAIERVRAGLTDGVVVAWLDRFSRAHVGDALRAVEDVRSHGGRVVALDVVGLDPDDPFGEYALTVMLAMSRMQLRRIGERWAAARRNAIERGVQTGPIPFGYRADENRRLHPEPREAEVVRELFRRRAGGATPLELARFLDRAAPRGDGRLWPRATAKFMIANPTYLGAVRNGPYVNKHAHQPLVEEALWRAAQAMAGVHPGRSAKHPMTGVVRCASCGHLLKGSYQYPPRKRMYKCSGRFASGMCPGPAMITAAPLEAEAVRQLAAHLRK